MTPEISLEQAIYACDAGAAPQCLARSPGFVDAWDSEAQRLIRGFGEPPAGCPCPDALFAQPLATGYVALVQVSELGERSSGSRSRLGFRLLAVPRDAYERWLEEPFGVADRYPPPWNARGELPSLSYPAKPAWRSVEAMQDILQREEGPVLLGAAQALVDGARIAFVRQAPANDLLRNLWALLPSSTRSGLWPATFAFSSELGFNAVAVPEVQVEEFQGYLTETQAAEYPEGRYELHLQIAIEDGDQAEVDRLFARRSRAQTLRLAVTLVAVALLLALAMQVLTWSLGPPRSGKRSPQPHAPTVRQQPGPGHER